MSRNRIRATYIFLLSIICLLFTSCSKSEGAPDNDIDGLKSTVSNEMAEEEGEKTSEDMSINDEESTTKVASNNEEKSTDNSTEEMTTIGDATTGEDKTQEVATKDTTIKEETTIETIIETTVEATEEITTTKEEATTQEETTTAVVITDIEKTMYSTTSLNVRSGPSADYDKIGSLKKGQQVKVTGKAEQTGWYRIEYSGKTGFVSGKYLQDEPLPEETTQAPTQAPTQSGGSLEKVLNSAALNPTRSDFTPLNELMDKLFSEIFKEGMSTYQKVKACYDYLINSCSYGHNEYVYDYIEAYFYGYKYQVSAYGILKGHIGVCDDYSAAFAMLMQAIGLDCYVVGGQTSKAGGGYTGHAWCEMNVNGVIYVFDPQVEDNIAKGGTIKYYRFGKTYEQVPGKYIKE